jgi:hypothetical protein
MTLTPQAATAARAAAVHPRVIADRRPVPAQRCFDDRREQAHLKGEAETQIDNGSSARWWQTLALPRTDMSATLRVVE